MSYEEKNNKQESFEETTNNQSENSTNNEQENVANQTTDTEENVENVNNENNDQNTTDDTTEETKIDDKEKTLLELNTIKDKYIRLSAEFDNYRKRTIKEKMEWNVSAREELLKDILPVIDNFERAMKAMETAKEIEPVKEGITLIYNKFKEFMQQKGVKEIEAQNLDFNTDLHEAVTKIPAPSEELKGKIVDVIEKGYFINDRVMRFAKVVIGE